MYPLDKCPLAPSVRDWTKIRAQRQVVLPLNPWQYVWDHFHCRESFVRKFLRDEMNWSLQHSTRPGKKVPDGVTYILTNAFFYLAYTISENSVTIELMVNTDQTLVTYAAGASETYAPKGSKQVEIVGKDEKRGFTLVFGVSMDGHVLPFQAIYTGSTPRSLPSPGAPEYHRATEELKFRIESGGDNHWSTISTMQSYVQHILVPYFEGHRQDQNQICIWQIDCWSVHRSAEFRQWMYNTYPWIRIHYVPANCTGLFQPCDVGIQRVLKLAIRRSALQDIINDTMEQLERGVEPNMVTFEKRLPVVRDRSVRWFVNGYEAINNPELVKKVIPKDALSFTHSLDITTGFPTLFYWTEWFQPLLSKKELTRCPHRLCICLVILDAQVFPTTIDIKVKTVGNRLQPGLQSVPPLVAVWHA